mmetsp:Transcript_31584/g.27978  ORF Transcript_31584/g.27978 Transcript_31584/m.27978 type:complete len:200 (+) Transcript_31584:32-631(+)
MINFLNALEKEPTIGPFMEPVDWKALGLDDYPAIVKKPMDLRSIRDRAKNDKYASLDAFYADVMLIWNNCKAYNIAESEIYRMAEDLERTCKKLYKKMIINKKTKTKDESESLKNNLDFEKTSNMRDEDEEEGDISFDDRIKFTEHVRKLTIENMTVLVRMIQEQCPNVLEDLDSDKLQIKVNEIDKLNFDKFMDFVQD